ncbi:DNA topoisomerase I, partial [Candidatus Poribacteria bacterium]
IISTLFERGYVVKEKGRLVPTELGKLVNKLLIKSFPEIMDVKFTANMESKLDEIEEGRANWIDVLKEFYANFRRYLEAAPRAMSEAKKEMVEETDEVCKLCGRKMVIRWGRYGRFLACSAYPECKFTRPLGIGVKCPKCGGELVERRSKKGKTFYGCENYPDCDYVVWDKPVDKPCPKCGFPFLVEKRGQRGRRYLACPNEGCDHVER